MRSLAIGIAERWPTYSVAVAAEIDTPRLDTPRKVAPTLPSPQIAPTSPAPASTIAHPNLGRVKLVLRTDAGGWDVGCALDHFEPHERVASQTRFAMPIPSSDLWGLLPEPGVTHADRDGVRDGDHARCTPFVSNHLCVNAEIKRRTDVVGIFPNEAAIVRLVGALLLEQDDEWQLKRRYMQLEGLQTVVDNQTARLSAVVN